MVTGDCDASRLAFVTEYIGPQVQVQKDAVCAHHAAAALWPHIQPTYMVTVAPEYAMLCSPWITHPVFSVTSRELHKGKEYKGK
jgi:hypothetical protein